MWVGLPFTVASVHPSFQEEVRALSEQAGREPVLRMPGYAKQSSGIASERVHWLLLSQCNVYGIRTKLDFRFFW
jgi:hypothetical protein